MPRRPALRQFGDLKPSDFKRSLVWINVHTEDYDEPWYDDCDEETFRPYIDGLPVSASDGMLLVAADARLSDGSVMPGFFTPAFDDDLGQTQPHLLLPNGSQGFWAGMLGWTDAKKSEVLGGLAKTSEAVFPISFTSLDGLMSDVTTIVVNGFAASKTVEPVAPVTAAAAPARGWASRLFRR